MKLFLFVCVILAVVFAMFPVCSIDSTQVFSSTVGMPTNLGELNLWVRRREEADASHLRSTSLAQRIEFYNREAPNLTEIALVYFHGFSASNQEMSPVVEELAVKLAANLYLPRWKGHGMTDTSTLRDASPSEWLKQAGEAIEVAARLGNKVVLMGTSMGAMMAISASFQSDKIAALILVSPMVRLKNFSANYLNYQGGYWLGRYVQGDDVPFVATHPIQNLVWTNPKPLRAVSSAVAVMEYVRALPLKSMKIPTLFLYTSKDETVDPEAIGAYYEQWPSPKKKLHEIHSSHHVVAGNATSPQNNDETKTVILNFLSDLSIQ